VHDRYIVLLTSFVQLLYYYRHLRRRAGGTRAWGWRRHLPSSGCRSPSDTGLSPHFPSLLHHHAPASARIFTRTLRLYATSQVLIPNTPFIWYQTVARRVARVAARGLATANEPYDAVVIGGGKSIRTIFHLLTSFSDYLLLRPRWLRGSYQGCTTRPSCKYQIFCPSVLRISPAYSPYHTLPVFFSRANDIFFWALTNILIRLPASKSVVLSVVHVSMSVAFPQKRCLTTRTSTMRSSMTLLAAVLMVRNIVVFSMSLV
jgi:hypothetical protein